MSEKDNQHSSIDNEKKETTIKPENPDQDMAEMKRWADEQKKKEAETLADKQNKKSSSEKGQPVKKTEKETSVKKEAKAMPNVGVSAKKADQKTKFAQPKAAAKPAAKTEAKPTAKKKTAAPAKKAKKKHNYLMWAAGIVVLIPCLLLVYILLGSTGSSDQPVEGSRFKGSLDPEITEAEVSELQSSLHLENVESINITLKSATLRVTINTNDDLSEEAISEIMASAYDQITEKFPADTYFKNRSGEKDSIIKMYDLDIQVYNYIPTGDEDKAGQIHMSRTQNSAAETYVDDILSTPKDEATSDELLNPDTSTPPSDDSNTTDEGE